MLVIQAKVFPDSHISSGCVKYGFDFQPPLCMVLTIISLVLSNLIFFKKAEDDYGKK